MNCGKLAWNDAWQLLRNGVRGTGRGELLRFREFPVVFSWRWRMGPKDMEEIGEEEIFEDFAEALQLRPLERRCEAVMRISMVEKMV